VSGLLNGDAIYKVTIHDTGTTPVFYGLQQIATGLRNAAGIVVHPVSGALYFEDNGIDGLVDVDEPTSADELNVIAAADIGTSVFNFGFPNDYIEYRTGRHIGSGAIQPLVAFQPVPDALNGSESEGPAEIAIAPSGFPSGLNNGIFVGFHGRFNHSGLLNEENPVVYYDLGSGQYFHFIENDEPGIGHLDSLLATNDSLFLTDVSSAGSMDDGASSGVIYQIKVIGQPSPSPPKKQTLLSATTATLDDLFASLLSPHRQGSGALTVGGQEITSQPSIFLPALSLREAVRIEPRVERSVLTHDVAQPNGPRVKNDYVFPEDRQVGIEPELVVVRSVFGP
jgi:hypothetical protein